jgi:pimeloyl-ACP methyl ester carboxylesterase
MKLNFKQWPARNTDNTNIHQEIDKNTPLLLLHGLGGTGKLWRPIAVSFEEERNIYSPDQRGHGESIVANIQDVPDREFSPDNYAKDVAETFEGRAPKFWVIGHSMGGRTAAAFAANHAGLCAGAILVDTHLSSAAGGSLGTSFEDFLIKLPPEFSSREAAGQFLDTECPDPSIGAYLKACLIPAADDRTRLVFPFQKEALLKTYRASQLSPVFESLEKAREQGVPVLALRGAKSLVWPLRDYEEAVRRLEPHGVQFETFADTGHGLPFEKRKEFVERVREFISAG